LLDDVEYLFDARPAAVLDFERRPRDGPAVVDRKIRAANWARVLLVERDLEEDAALA
jgi:hypothetical protein